MNKPKNIVFFFSDQQRWDTLGCYGQKLDVTPNLDRLAAEGTKFDNAMTCQPVCGPARACLQTGQYATQTGCFANGIPLPFGKVKTLAQHFNEIGYQTGYVGKWHLASDDFAGIDYTTRSIPPERRGGYKDYWMAADLLEHTSHGYNGYVFDAQESRVDFVGYRPNCITDYAIDFLHNRTRQRGPKQIPFFLFISQIEPHHQNDRGRVEGPDGSRAKFANYEAPYDLASAGKGNWKEQYPDYLGACHSLDENVGRLVDTLKETGDWENTVFVYTSDHGAHFNTRTMEYKRTGHEASVHIPLIICGPGFEGGNTVKEVVSLLDLPVTLLAQAGAQKPEGFMGRDITPLAVGAAEGWNNEVFIQISESQIGRALRTDRYKYCVAANVPPFSRDTFQKPDADVYYEDYLYDLEADPYEQNNLIENPGYSMVCGELREKLLAYILGVEAKTPRILPKVSEQ